MKMWKKSVLVLVIGPVSLCSPSVYIVIVGVLFVVVLANVMFLCFFFLQYILPLFCKWLLWIHGDTRPLPRFTEAKYLQHIRESD